MPPRAASHKLLQRRLRRTMNYGQLRMDNLTMPLSEMVVDYFDRHNPFDYLDIGYASKLARDGCVDPTTLIVAMVYVDRLRRANPEYFIETSPENLYLSALVIAGKFLQDGGLDEYIWNDEWAQCSSRTIQRVNELELEILCKIDWNLHISENDFKDAVDSAEQWIALRSLKKHKFLTYNDITILAKKWDASWKQIKMLFTYTSAISATYLGTLYLALLCATFHQQSNLIITNEVLTTANNLYSQKTDLEATTTTNSNESISSLSTTTYNLNDFVVISEYSNNNNNEHSLSNDAPASDAHLVVNDSCANDYSKIVQQKQQQKKFIIPNFQKFILRHQPSSSSSVGYKNPFEQENEHQRRKEIECY